MIGAGLGFVEDKKEPSPTRSRGARADRRGIDGLIARLIVLTPEDHRDAAAQDWSAGRVRTAMLSLSAQDRTVLYRFWLRRLPQPEIARRLGLKRHQLEYLARTALTRLHAVLLRCAGGGAPEQPASVMATRAGARTGRNLPTPEGLLQRLLEPIAASDRVALATRWMQVGCLEAAIDALPDLERRIAKARWFEGRSVGAIAREVSCPRSVAHWRLRRIVARLRVDLGGSGVVDPRTAVQARLRVRRRETLLRLVGPNPAVEPGNADPDDSARIASLRRDLLTLPPRQRTSIYRYWWLGRSRMVIARALGVTHRTIRCAEVAGLRTIRLHRAGTPTRPAPSPRNHPPFPIDALQAEIRVCREILMELPPRERTVLYRYFMRRQPIGRISAALRLSPRSIEVAHQHGLAYVLARLRGEHPDPLQCLPMRGAWQSARPEGSKTAVPRLALVQAAPGLFYAPLYARAIADPRDSSLRPAGRTGETALVR